MFFFYKKRLETSITYWFEKRYFTKGNYLPDWERLNIIRYIILNNVGRIFKVLFLSFLLMILTLKIYL